jgi:riboflavin kinase/FMN adenylyltransferase
VNVIHTASELAPGARRVCAAIGVFDGVHLGHQQVLRQTLADAQAHEGLAVAITFDCHPNSVVAPARTPPMIYPLWKKLRAIESLGVDAALVIRFEREFSRIPGEEFIRHLARDFGGLASVCVGGEFTFGHQRSGNVALLQSLGAELNFTVHGLAAVALNGQVVSSTRIREAVQRADLDAAGQLLGRAYSLCGAVVRGDQLGRRLGVPTANVNATGLVTPPHGVYAAHALVRGKRHPAAVNIGVRPTVASAAPKLQVEAHLLDFEGDLYGEELEIVFAEKLRDERKFPSVEALTAQIHMDIAAARKIFS